MTVNKQQDSIVITSAARTPIGNFQGALKNFSATDLGAAAIAAAVSKAQLTPDAISAVIMGCVLSAGLGQAPARQAALKAKLPLSTDCTTINKMCGSGMKAIMLACDILQAHEQEIYVAGGMESMTNAPYLLPKARQGYRLGHQAAVDHLFYDGLEDAYEKGSLMGVFAQRCATQYQFSRQAQDQFALSSLKKAQDAADAKLFLEEITPLTDIQKDVVIELDEGPVCARPEKIPLLKPAFAKDGTVTAANSSSISDGAAAVTLMHDAKAKALGITPLARVVGYATHSQDPSLFTTAPIFAIQKLLKQVQWQKEDVDLWEINEAFAVVVMAAAHDLQLPLDKINIHGGGCVLGHPIGATGARIIVTLLHALKNKGLKRGVAALCIGGGEATALAVELC